MKLFDKIVAQKAAQRRADIQRSILHYKARRGGELFGAVPKGHRREFFCLDRHTWVWHEEWVDTRGNRQAVTTRYDIRPTGIIKSQGNRSYQRLTSAEARNLYKAAQLYVERVGGELERIAHAA